MGYIILEVPKECDKYLYRGINRMPPMLIETSSKELIELWGWYADLTGDGGFINDYKRAKELIEGYRKIGYIHDLVRIDTKPDLKPNEELLGVDVTSCYGDSMLTFGLDYNEHFKGYGNTRIKGESIFYLIQKYFQPRLNENLLFNQVEDAQLFIDVIEDFGTLNPQMFEYDRYQFKYVFKVN